MDPTETDSDEEGPTLVENLSFAERLLLKKSRPYARTTDGESSKSQKVARVNKNRPREVSSKIPLKPLGRVHKKDATTARDPRFDSLCGNFDEKNFRKSYSFINDIRAQERLKLSKAYKKEQKHSNKDPEKLQHIKYLIQRMDNQEREWKKRECEDEKLNAEKRQQIDMMLEGKKPYFMKKSEKKFQNLVGTYDKLKSDGKLEKRLKKKNKKNRKKPFMSAGISHDDNFEPEN